MALTAKQKKFVAEYLVDLNATQAAIRAGYSARTAEAIGHENLRKPKIAEAVQDAMGRREQRTEITQDRVLERWWAIATADPNEIIYHRRVCCRYCFGLGHEYQWIDKQEYEIEVFTAQQMEKTIPDNLGGFGFDRTIRPHPKCPKCRGEGFGEIKATDTRDLGPQAKMLYAGVKQTQAGFEVKLQDQGKALENVARHLGMFKDKIEHNGNIGVQIIDDIGSDDDDTS